MYRLFKKLRHKFLSEGKPNGYYKYALGEVFLVMVGILLAISDGIRQPPVLGYGFRL